MSDVEHKGREVSADDSRAALARVMSLYRQEVMDADEALRSLQSVAETARSAARDLEDVASQADDAAQQLHRGGGYMGYSDTRPLDAKTEVPGAHGAYR